MNAGMNLHVLYTYTLGILFFLNVMSRAFE